MYQSDVKSMANLDARPQRGYHERPMKKILVIDESPLFRQYLLQKLEELGFEPLQSVSGLDGLAKIRTEIPDLVIMDYFLSRRSSLEILREKTANANTAAIPVIMVSKPIEKKALLEVARFNVRKFLAKPLKLDALLAAVSEVLDVKLAADDTPCIIEAHFNDEILFVEVARGLNRDKIELLGFKITELLQLYGRRNPKVLIIMTDIALEPQDRPKLDALLRGVLEVTRSPQRAVRVLTTSEAVRQAVADSEEFGKIEVTDNLATALDGLLGMKVSSFMDTGRQVVKEDILTASTPAAEGRGESFQLRYDLQKEEERPVIAAVDDDVVIQELVKKTFSDTGWPVRVFDNGRQFVEALSGTEFDLLLLDLMMPEMDGFAVLEHLKERVQGLPVIVLSALSKRETVTRAIKLGVKSYLIKPLKPEMILKKTAEVLRLNF